jgi:TPR repeat protein
MRGLGAVVAMVSLGLFCASAPLLPAAPADHEDVLKRWSGKSPAELRAAAEAGNAEAQHSLAHTFFKRPNATPGQLEEGIQWLQRAADQNLAVAQAGLGMAYFESKIVAQNYPLGWKWMRAAAAQELPYALNYVGFAHLHGWGTRADATEAVRWYQAAVAKGFPAAMTHLGWMTLQGKGGLAVDPAAGVKLIRQAADAGYAAAQVDLGLMLHRGHNLPKDAAAALAWFRKAAAQDFGHGQLHLANAYALGTSVPQDLVAATDLYRKAAAQGNGDAAFALAELYEAGEGSPRDTADSVNALYERAAEAGHHRSAERLSQRLRWGFAGPPDRLKACGWLCQAHVNRYGYGMSESQLLPQTDEESRQFAALYQMHRRACQFRELPALLQMGRWCVEGTVAPVDLVEAYKWFTLARQRGDATVEPELTKLRARLTPEQIKDAERRVANLNR